MALIPTVGRKSAKIRALIASMYVLLSLGAITTLYPFLVMIGVSITSDYDQAQYRIIPAFLTSDDALISKYAEDKYNTNLVSLCDAYHQPFISLQKVALPDDPSAAKYVPQWHAFFASLPLAYKQAGFRGQPGQYTPSKLLNRYRQWLSDRYDGNIDKVAKTYVEEDTSFLSVFPPYERPTQRTFVPGKDIKSQEWAQFEQGLPEDWMHPILCDPLYQHYLHDEVYQSGKIDDLNAVWHTHYTQWSQIILPMTVADAPYKPDWIDFVRTKLPLTFVKWSKGSPDLTTLTGDQLRTYASQIASADSSTLSVVSVENLWRAQPGMANVTIPLAEDDREFALTHQGDLRREFIGRNYSFVTDYLLLHGRGAWNTFIYCAGAVLSAIIVNPMCAYALSRFKLKQATGILLFLLATMAFPAEVTMIPNFLLIKQLGLLNTFWALVLPGAASGFSIFLLKGFFDSLPAELYEAGMLDGASEFTLFTRVTMPLSGPIFAVIGLGAFTGMYGAFMVGMLLEQKQSQWPLITWIYEFQTLAAPNYVMMAALVLVSIPTLVVFLFAQKVIMKGIIVPSMK